VPGRQVGVFTGNAILNEYWSSIARWIAEADGAEIAAARRGPFSQRR